MTQSFKDSFPSRKSQERGATLVRNAAGEIKVRNESSGTAGTFQPSRNVGRGETIVGTYHTHPYDASEGSHTGVGFSAADINYANHYKEQMYVDAGNRQFMVMPTQETPAIDYATLDKDWNDAFTASSVSGKTFEEATREASLNVAKKYKMAYFEGAKGSFQRLSC